jgi:hypothetical protein
MPTATLLGMILTELGLHFTREGDRWRCVAHPDLVMLSSDRYDADGQGFATPFLALLDRHRADFVQRNPGAARSTRG